MMSKKSAITDNQELPENIVSNENNHSNDSEKMMASAQVTDEQVINWIKSRRSIGNLNIPAPSHKQIKEAVACAMTAPDHKKLQPWRFIVVEGNERHALGRAFVEAAEAKARREGETLDEKTLKKTYNMPLRAPVIITAVTNIKYHEKVPEFEQLLSTGAAVQNLILALKAQGFSTVWRTGLLCNEPAVKSYFNVGSEDYVAAFVYTGSSACDMPERDTIETEALLTFYQTDS